jgi:primosomal protein N' (replication factor Y)
MRQEWREAGRVLLSRDLEGRIVDRVSRSEQVLILLNRRGFASSLRCRACGDHIECPNCAVSLTLHRQQRALRCHYCDHSQPVASTCPQCGSDALRDLGFGTERLQEAVQMACPSARVGRFDADQTQRRGAHGRILASFGAGEIDILVGTQMLAKGHDFPGVTLVGVIGADASLGVPDFRASERTFQLLTQMAGRAGRGEVPGEVVMQARSPEHYSIQAALEHDFEAFYEREIRFRERLRYPPFVSLAACVCRGKVAPVVKEEADRLAAAIRRAGGREVVVLGPASPPIGRMRGLYRMQILVKAPSRAVLTASLRGALSELETRSTHPRDLVVDVDPRNLM